MLGDFSKSLFWTTNLMNFWSISGSFSLLCILGLTWIFGFTYFAEGSEWLAVLFALLNSFQVGNFNVRKTLHITHAFFGFQGFFILLFHVILNEKAKHETTRQLRYQINYFRVSLNIEPFKTSFILSIFLKRHEWRDV